ncbi:MAG: exodeoxyribonuclease VII small subunit [Sulfuritalea sp.]|nr:exodeoxyribonuclease VII small subunit [Sulfuritalea sp.]
MTRSTPSPKNLSTSLQTLATPAHYEAAMDELEGLVAQMEAGDLPLDQLLSQYERGAHLLQFCRDKLQAVEDQMKVLDGGVLKPWKNT